MRRLRVQGNLRRLTRPRLRRHWRPAGPGTLLHLSAEKLGTASGRRNKNHRLRRSIEPSHVVVRLRHLSTQMRGLLRILRTLACLRRRLMRAQVHLAPEPDADRRHAGYRRTFYSQRKVFVESAVNSRKNTTSAPTSTRWADHGSPTQMPCSRFTAKFIGDRCASTRNAGG